MDAQLQLEEQAAQNNLPGTASNGERYLVASGSGAWAGKVGQLALMWQCQAADNFA
ncbi:hypothetical protein ACJJID_05020 [Microbulbifer sp. CnH-101-G]|uniref:hypothetical protein n=1 Tax=Microbulbifer sp. CnH-101-G TaxID=3243393 RepID=UPI00403A0C8F